MVTSVRAELQRELGERAAYLCFMGLVQERVAAVVGAAGFEAPASPADVRARVREVLTDEVCQDVEVVGWLHQAWIAERKDQVFAGFKQRRKAGPAEIPAATQLFTPHWIVRHLVENTLGRLWLLNHPESRLAEQMPYYVTPAEPDTDFLRISGPEDLTVLDPACGSGHMLTYAFDLLHAIYTEAGYDAAEIPQLILTRNLYGVEIDPDVAALASFALTMKARQRGMTGPIEPQVCALRPVSFTADELTELPAGDWNAFEHADTFGSLIRPGELPRRSDRPRERLVREQAAYLSGDYHVVVTNPPYLGSKNLSDLLVERLRQDQLAGKLDLYAAFIGRAMALARPGGLVGMITMQGWMFLPSYTALRESVRDRWSVVTLSHLGPGAFEVGRGEVVTTCAFVLRNAPASGPGAYFRLVDVPRDRKELVAREAYRGAGVSTGSTSGVGVGRRFDVDGHQLSQLPGGVFAYWLTPELLDAFAHLPPIAERVDTRSGMATGDNERFLRYWWEVSTEALGRDATWVPYNKGGRAHRWFGTNEVVVQWHNDGEQIKATKAANLAAGLISTNNAKCWNQDRYFQPSVTWTTIGHGRLAARYADPGSIFDTKGQCLFADSEEDRLFYLALLNSEVAGRFLEALAPALDFNSGAIRRLPDPYADADRDRIVALAREAVDLQRSAWNRQETSPDFVPPGFERGTVAEYVRGLQEQRTAEVQRLAAIEDELDGLLARAYDGAEVAGPDRAVQAVPTSADIVRDLISYAVGCLFGRYAAPVEQVADNVIPVAALPVLLDDFLAATFGEEHLEENRRFVAEAVGSDYLAKSFYADHVLRFRKRPVYWMFTSSRGAFQALTYLHSYTPETVVAVRKHLTARPQRPELTAYDRDVLEPLADLRLSLDLDDGVRVNYTRLGAGLKKIPGLG
ncbi:BREX-1 system adenine-specific DNA-methyltransferase PglX [Nocardioides marmoriginsengisoli]|uniref:site-specific DNA-methyltransferase (adenine-specific) n=1 Tax=Nocardioides marmoriginsengisoli TaxID=661483 RepID=A0A3N0CPU2_9ACTN|nr:BREX-1 system adenine-specific DNA-methyltransferase PglX [Nocardioides marmoriginsengisoli]